MTLEASKMMATFAQVIKKCASVIPIIPNGPANVTNLLWTN